MNKLVATISLTGSTFLLNATAFIDLKFQNIFQVVLYIQML